MCWCYGTFFASCVKDTVQGNCNAMYTTGYRYAGIYRQSRVLTVKNNCSIPGRTPRRWWTGPTASATTSRVTATMGSSAPDPTTGNAFAVRTGTYLRCTVFAPRLEKDMSVFLRYGYVEHWEQKELAVYLVLKQNVRCYSGEHYYEDHCFRSGSVLDLYSIVFGRDAPDTDFAGYPAIFVTFNW